MTEDLNLISLREAVIAPCTRRLVGTACSFCNEPISRDEFSVDLDACDERGVTKWVGDMCLDCGDRVADVVRQLRAAALAPRRES